MSIEAPLVSIVLVTYNHKNYIAKAIESVLNQEVNFKFELLIGEDDSSDGTRQIVSEFQKQNPEIIRTFLRDRKDVYYRNGKPTGTTNWINTLNEAKGKYIALIEGDDYWDSVNKLKTQVGFLEANPEYYGSYHHSIVRYENKDKADHLFRPQMKMEMDVTDTLAALTPFHTSSFVFRTAGIFPLPNWFIHCASGDMALFFLVAAKGKLKGFSHLKGIYRKHEGGFTSMNFQNKLYFIHLNRIMMLTYFNDHIKQASEPQIANVITDHISEIIKGSKMLKFGHVLRILKAFLLSKFRS